MVEILHWPNAETVMKELCRGVEVDGTPVVRVGRETAPGDEFTPPCIRVERTGGSTNQDRTEDTPLIEVACFGTTYEQAQAMSMSVDRLLAQQVGELIGPDEDQAELDSFRMENGPIRPAWGQNARRDIVTWRLSWRPRITTE